MKAKILLPYVHCHYNKFFKWAFRCLSKTSEYKFRIPNRHLGGCKLHFWLNSEWALLLLAIRLHCVSSLNVGIIGSHCVLYATEEASAKHSLGMWSPTLVCIYICLVKPLYLALWLSFGMYSMPFKLCSFIPIEPIRLY